jgi:hypothetical protein
MTPDDDALEYIDDLGDSREVRYHAPDPRTLSQLPEARVPRVPALRRTGDELLLPTIGRLTEPDLDLDQADADAEPDV